MTEDRAARHELVALQLWRRLLVEGQGPELTLEEAAAALGVSLSTIRRLIKEGRLVTRRVGRRYRVVPAPTSRGEAGEAGRDLARVVAELEQELRRAAEKLTQLERERDDLQAELEAARRQAADAGEQIMALWRLVRGRAGEFDTSGFARALVAAGPPNRVRDVIAEARETLRKRHRWLIPG